MNKLLTKSMLGLAGVLLLAGCAGYSGPEVTEAEWDAAFDFVGVTVDLTNDSAHMTLVYENAYEANEKITVTNNKTGGSWVYNRSSDDTYWETPKGGTRRQISETDYHGILSPYSYASSYKYERFAYGNGCYNQNDPDFYGDDVITIVFNADKKLDTIIREDIFALGGRCNLKATNYVY